MDILVVLEDSNGKIHRLGLEAIVGAQVLANSHNLSVASLVTVSYTHLTLPTNREV